LSVDPLTKVYPELRPYQFASNSPIQGIDLDGKEIFYHDPLAGLRLLKGMFLGWASDFSNGALKTREGGAQLGLAKQQQASYNNQNVPQHIQSRLNQNDKIGGGNKMVEGTIGMVQASADAVGTVVPLGEGVSAGKNTSKALARTIEKKALSGAEKAATSMANNAFKMSEKALVKSGNEAVQILEREAAKGGSNIALGVREHLGSFANKVGGTTWETWGTKNFQSQFLETINNSANKIHFNLDGIPNVWKAVSDGAKGFGKSQHVTSWELYQIYSKPGASQRTTFYLNGKVVPSPF